MSSARLATTAALVTVVAAGLLVTLGVTARDAALLTLGVGVQAWAGGYLWRVAVDRQEDRAWDPIAMLGSALALGTAAAVLSGALLSRLVPGGWGWTVPALAATALWVVRRARGLRLPGAEWAWRRSTVVGFATAVVVGIATIAINVARYPLGTVGPWTTYHRDMLYFEGLANSTGAFGPHDSIFMAGGDVRYHWLAYGWVGQLSHAVEAAPFAALTRVLPLVALMGCAALVVTWAAKLVDRWPATLLAALLLTAGGYVGALNGTVLNFDSPSQNLSTLWLVGALIAALAYLSGRGSWAFLGVVVVLIAATTGGKISSGAVALVPLTLVAVVMTVRRDSERRRAWLLLTLAGFAAVAVYALWVGGSASPGDLKVLSLDSRASSIQGLDSSPGPRGVMLGTLSLMLAMAARWWGLAWLVGDRAWRWRNDVVAGLGLVLVGLVPVIFLSQGVNETWFALAASAPLAALSAAGVSTSWTAVQNRAALVTSVILGVVAVVLVPFVWVPQVINTTSVRFFGPWIAYGVALVGAVAVGLVFGRRRRWMVMVATAISVLVFAGSVSRVSPAIAARVHAQSSAAGISTAAPLADDSGSGPGTSSGSVGDIMAPVIEPPPVVLAGSPPDRVDWTAAEAEAAAFVRGNVPGDGLLVTNDTTSFLVPALTQRRTYISGSPYQALYASPDTVKQIPDRIAAALAFTQSLDSDALATLCRAGVTWGWVALDGTTLRSWEPFASTVFSNDDVAILKLNEGTCR